MNQRYCFTSTLYVYNLLFEIYWAVLYWGLIFDIICTKNITLVDYSICMIGSDSGMNTLQHSRYSTGR